MEELDFGFDINEREAKSAAIFVKMNKKAAIGNQATPAANTDSLNPEKSETLLKTTHSEASTTGPSSANSSSEQKKSTAQDSLSEKVQPQTTSNTSPAAD